MGLIRRIGKPTKETRTLTWIIYFLLVTGGITMVYPFLVMISGSFKSEVDLRDYDAIPAYFHSDTALYRKYVESRYNESVRYYNINARQEVFSFKAVVPPKDVSLQKVADWREFLGAGTLPPGWTMLAHSFAIGNRMYPEYARKYRGWIVKNCGGELVTFHRKYGGLVNSWLNVSFPLQYPADRSFKLGTSPLALAQVEFKSVQPARDQVPLSLDGQYTREYLIVKYGKDIAAYNRAHGTKYGGYQEIYLPSRVPAGGRERNDWLDFVRNEINVQFLKVDPPARGAFAEFLSSRYEGKIALLNREYGAKYGDFSQVPFPRNLLTMGAQVVDWELFTRAAAPEMLSITGPEMGWRAFLKRKYAGKLGDLNRAHAASYASFERVPMPTVEAEWSDMKDRSGALRREFAGRNYRHVMEFLFLHGRGMWNTFWFCLLSVAAALIINPIAAYAMSRFNLPSTYKILLFLLATMAFPPMVTAIPNFLLLKELGLLNTFSALILPGIVSGFSIFLLKGFFDSLPRSVYEAAQIDGAGEWTMFWQLTMYLSKPILAVIALGAFTGAFGAFMFAFIVCQDERMWTLMVWLYQLQQFSHQSVTFAALLLASIPTFLAFVLCQKFIMEGIVIPTEK